MSITIEEAVSLLKKHDNILILSHMSPDGDTLGCAYALCYALKSINKSARVVCSDDVPEKFAYLKGEDNGGDYENGTEDFVADYVVAVDIAATQLLGDGLAQYADCIDLCIDHHPSNGMFAKQTLLVPTASAACEIIFDVVTMLEVPITKHIANCLYTGIVTDSGCFKYSNTSAKTHIIAAKLFEYGAEYEKLNRMLFDTKTKHRIAIEQQVLNGIEFFCDDRVAVIGITQKMIDLSGADESELDGVSALPRTIEGVEIGITIKEKSDGSHKASVRTTQYVDASLLCAKFGGGGHKRAAGCLIKADYKTAKQLLVKEAKVLLCNS